MRSGPVLLKIFGSAFGDQMNRQTGSVRSDDGTGLADRFYAREEAALDFQIFGDGFNDPIHLATPGDVVFKITGGDETRVVRSEECGGARFFCCFQTGKHDAIPHGRAVQRQTFALFRGREARGNDVQQVARDAGVRQLRGDARAHGARPQDCCTFDASFHQCPSRRLPSQ